MVNLCIAQKETWTLNPENSFISYDAKHILHSWKGMNTNVKGVAKVEANKINQIAILTLVKDFDSNNSGRDAHALEVLESLSYPEVRFYSDSITVAQDSIKITGLFNFHGVNQSRSIAALIENEKNKKIIIDSIEILKQISGEMSKKLIKESKKNKILIDTIKIDSISKIKLITTN